MIGPVFANLVSKAKIPWMKQVQLFDDSIVVKSIVFWIVDGQRPSAALRVLRSHVVSPFFATATSLPHVILTVGKRGGAGAAAGGHFP